MAEKRMKFKKITENYMAECNYDFNVMDLPEIVKSVMIGNSVDLDIRSLEAIEDCESPIEQLFALAVESSGLLNLNIFNNKIFINEYKKQKELIVDKDVYIVDFYLDVSYDIKNIEKRIKFVIELDGHEFHQKTKEQVERDNKRSRGLQKSGYEIIRFSGTEVYRHTYDCIEQLTGIITSKLDE